MTLAHSICLVGAYVLGSVPFGVLIARMNGVDIMSVGSGNTGATNVYRTLGRGPGLLVFALDVLKGVLPALIALKTTNDKSFAFGVGMMAVVGHSFSPWLKFKGGKGVATGLGALLGAAPLVAVSALGLFLVILGTTRYLSLASMAAAVSLPVWAYVFGEPLPLKIGTAALAAFVIWRHRANFSRLLAGTEPKFDFKSKNSGPAPQAEASTEPAPNSTGAQGDTA